jgi:superoxide dismutase
MITEMKSVLQSHLALCQELLAVIEKEGQSLRTPDNDAAFSCHQAKKNLLPRLNQSLDQLKSHRMYWQRLSPAERRQHPEISALLRLNQDVTMKILVLDRENEQTLLRRGLVPARQLPPVNRQRPHYVADLYRRTGAG